MQIRTCSRITSYTVMKPTKSHNKLDFSIDFGDSDVDLVDRHLHTSIELHQVRDLCIQVEIGFQFLDGQFDAANVKFRNVEVDVWRCARSSCAGA